MNLGIDEDDEDDNNEDDDKDDDKGDVDDPTVEAYVNLAMMACKYCKTEYHQIYVLIYTHSMQSLPRRCHCQN